MVPPTDGDPRNAVYAGDARAFEKSLEAASKMSFGVPPYSAGLAPRFKSSIRLRRTASLELGSVANLTQNPIFEIAS
jgi:hypothetical protein